MYAPLSGAYTSIMARFPPAFMGIVSVGRAVGNIISSSLSLILMAAGEMTMSAVVS